MRSLSETRESSRVEILRSYRVLDTPPEPVFDAIVALAKDLFQVPVAGIAFVAEQRVWLKAAEGFDGQDVPREDTLCDLALSAPEVVVVPDLAKDPRTRERSAVAASGLRFYAAAALRSPQGVAIGALFVADRTPRSFGPGERRRLKGLGSLVMDQVELRAALSRIARTEARLKHVADALSMETGEAFVVALARFLPEALDVDYAFISEVGAVDSGIAHCTICERGKVQELFDYELEGTPCAEVVAGEPRCYPKGVRELFPADTALGTMGAEAYAAVPLFDARRRTMGLLGVLSRTPFADGNGILTELSIFGPRAAAEMERLRAERRVREGARRREDLVQALPDMVFHIGRDGRFLDFHPGLDATPIVPPEEFLGKRVVEVLPPEIAREGMKAVLAALGGQGIQMWEYELQGRAFEARIVASGPDEVVSFVRDVTPQR